MKGKRPTGHTRHKAYLRGAPKSGDRVAFVVVHPAGGTGQKLSVSQRSEDPDYVKTHNLRADYGYYAGLTAFQVIDWLNKAGLEAEGRRITQAAVHRATTTLPGQQRLATYMAALVIRKAPSARVEQEHRPPPSKKQQTTLAAFFQK